MVRFEIFVVKIVEVVVRGMEVFVFVLFKNVFIVEDDRILDKKIGVNSIEVKCCFNFFIFFCYKFVVVNFLW